MLIRKIHLVNFMSHRMTSIDLPPTGVVLITGSNGSGKSSLAEGVSVAAWGKTLRGSSGWVVGHDSSVTLNAQVGGKEIKITRTRSASDKIQLQWEPSPTKYATVTKAQTVLETHIGDFETWRRCAIFSSQDASHFTLSSDAERKRLLESLLGLDKFDTALAKCRVDKKGLLSLRVEIDRKLARLDGSLRSSLTALEESEASLKRSSAYVQPHGPSAKELSDQLDNFRQSLAAVRNELRETLGLRSELRAKETVTKDKIEVVSLSNCPTCGQEIEGLYANRLRKEMQQDLMSISDALHKIKLDCNGVQKRESKLEEDQRKIHAKFLDAAQTENDGHATLREHLATQIEKTRITIKKLQADRAGFIRDLDNLNYDIALLENTETVLGTKGIRAHILGSALGALEVTSNKWLREISDESISLRIRPYTEKKTGGQREAIAIHVDGIAGGQGYKGASGGQRRRIDVALLLGLAELAQASNQYRGGTIFFDEVFDSLDSEGCKAVSRVMETLAKDRAVVVISHSSELVAYLHPIKHYQMSAAGVI